MDSGGERSRVDNVEADAGLVAFATILAMNRIAADPAQFRHALGHQDPVSTDELVRLAKGHDGVRAKAIKASFDRLERLPLPAMGCGPQGWFVIGRVSADAALIQRPGSSPERLDREGLDRIWSGTLILVTTREGVAGSVGRFDFTWFIPQIVRYRRLISEVLLITLALNLLGLAAPLFFQNVIDKVLVHNTVATLQVLSIGFLAVSAWEVVFGWLRTRFTRKRARS